jgi:hypothetical protein
VSNVKRILKPKFKFLKIYKFNPVNHAAIAPGSAMPPVAERKKEKPSKKICPTPSPRKSAR